MLGVVIGVVYYLAVFNLYKYAFKENKAKKIFLFVSLLLSLVLLYLGIALLDFNSNKEYLGGTLIISDLFIAEKLLNKE